MLLYIYIYTHNYIHINIYIYNFMSGGHPVEDLLTSPHIFWPSFRGRSVLKVVEPLGGAGGAVTFRGIEEPSSERPKNCRVYIQIIWYIIIYYDILLYIIIYYDILWYIMIYYDILWYIMIYYDILWYIMIYYDILWYIMIISWLYHDYIIGKTLFSHLAKWELSRHLLAAPTWPRSIRQTLGSLVCPYRRGLRAV